MIAYTWRCPRCGREYRWKIGQRWKDWKRGAPRHQLRARVMGHFVQTCSVPSDVRERSLHADRIVAELLA